MDHHDLPLGQLGAPSNTNSSPTFFVLFRPCHISSSTSGTCEGLSQPARAPNPFDAPSSYCETPRFYLHRAHVQPISTESVGSDAPPLAPLVCEARPITRLLQLFSDNCKDGYFLCPCRLFALPD
ncbi:uncharacterized protein VDAG_01550 [Verticillium dahliae VdLs.17]|uniref:Uncharacterized protein n=1 Tax=Verticillium dahliae (strain VdLs.17 / ATCC MYA-4575 / FGSC 10137) TaxID=498257 RepID=G2WSE7_VERDV|nr:uncharacterized protein VDAG_01550 [Verticillium dahliae VdLs.17]EGY17868.1 hypothetical protein VDAG_01550 [Verticillium dahliae VdLs.17]